MVILKQGTGVPRSMVVAAQSNVLLDTTVALGDDIPNAKTTFETPSKKNILTSRRSSRPTDRIRQTTLTQARKWTDVEVEGEIEVESKNGIEPAAARETKTHCTAFRELAESPITIHFPRRRRPHPTGSTRASQRSYESENDMNGAVPTIKIDECRQSLVAAHIAALAAVRGAERHGAPAAAPHCRIYMFMHIPTVTSLPAL
ncbi:hypothetical protein EVAR_16923_1 [Eumeta japonica]|uniref:Uncharacterized protein n=1 Tax=Eumeta variegata TaxID=151549 RepID=A0A4C1TVF6_EUMVA|nr:hypothetical protein EVAR_16923_1 [Eumeta japonica]